MNTADPATSASAPASQAAPLGGHVDEFLSAETGVYGHHANQVGQIQQVLDRVRRRAGVKRDPRLHSRAPNGLKRPVGVRPGLDMRSQDIGTSLGISVDIGVDRRDHEMDVHNGLHMRAERFDGGRAEGEVRHEMPVHHVDMHPVRALRFDRADFLAEIGEVGGQDRRGDLDGAVESHGGPHVRFPCT